MTCTGGSPRSGEARWQAAAPGDSTSEGTGDGQGGVASGEKRGRIRCQEVAVAGGARGGGGGEGISRGGHAREEGGATLARWAARGGNAARRTHKVQIAEEWPDPAASACRRGSGTEGAARGGAASSCSQPRRHRRLAGGVGTRQVKTGSRDCEQAMVTGKRAARRGPRRKGGGREEERRRHLHPTADPRRPLLHRLLYQSGGHHSDTPPPNATRHHPPLPAHASSNPTPPPLFHSRPPHPTPASTHAGGAGSPLAAGRPRATTGRGRALTDSGRKRAGGAGKGGGRQPAFSATGWSW